MGVVHVKQSEMSRVEQLFTLADEVMYDVKRNRRAYYAMKYVNEKGVITWAII